MDFAPPSPSQPPRALPPAIPSAAPPNIPAAPNLRLRTQTPTHPSSRAHGPWPAASTARGSTGPQWSSGRTDARSRRSSAGRSEGRCTICWLVGCRWWTVRWATLGARRVIRAGWLEGADFLKATAGWDTPPKLRGALRGGAAQAHPGQGEASRQGEPLHVVSFIQLQLRFLAQSKGALPVPSSGPRCCASMRNDQAGVLATATAHRRCIVAPCSPAVGLVDETAAFLLPSSYIPM